MARTWAGVFRLRTPRLLRKVPKKVLVPAVAALAAVVIVAAPAPVALVTAFLLPAAGLGLLGAELAALRRERRARFRERRHQAEAKRRERSSELVSAERLSELEHRLWRGDSRTAEAGLREYSVDPAHSPERRSRALEDLAARYEYTGDLAHAQQMRRSALLTDVSAPSAARVNSVMGSRGRTVHFDVLMVSHFALPGGTTGSNAQEIEAQSRAGLRTGLLHHPIADWTRSKPISPKIMRLVDGDRVRFVHWSDRITCDLLLIRHPKVSNRIADDLPDVEAAHTALVINQPPYRYYGQGGAGEEIWQLERVHSNILNRFGEHTWYPIGPAVRDALVGHHLDEMPEMPLSSWDWVNIIDMDQWVRPEPRPFDTTVRIGRHSRDHVSKWPETRELLEAAYPPVEGYEYRVLGGAESPERLLGGLPPSWTVHPFDTVPARDFLHELDLYVYFTSTDYVEAFGRSPLEAMAVGLPTVLPQQFKPLCGDAGIYTEPAGVQAEIDLLMTDRERHVRQVERARQVVRDRFSYDAHLRRLGDVGVRAARPQ